MKKHAIYEAAFTRGVSAAAGSALADAEVRASTGDGTFVVNPGHIGCGVGGAPMSSLTTRAGHPCHANSGRVRERRVRVRQGGPYKTVRIWSLRGLMSRIVVICTFAIFISSAIGQVAEPAKIGPVGGPPILRDVGIDHHEGASIPFDATFNDEDGNPVRLAQYFGQKPVILALVYYRCPMLCTMVLNDLTRSLNSLSTAAGDQFTVLAVSFDPGETPDLAMAKKKHYLRAYRFPHSEGGWHFLTGSQQSISRLTAAVGFRYAWDAKNKQWAHASGLVILTPDGRIARYFYGIDYAPADIRLALAEAGEKKISRSVTTRVLLYCFHYDPSTGKYGLAIMRLLQTGGIITLLLLGGSVWLTVRRDRRLSKPSGERPGAPPAENPGNSQ